MSLQIKQADVNVAKAGFKQRSTDQERNDDSKRSSAECVKTRMLQRAAHFDRLPWGRSVIGFRLRSESVPNQSSGKLWKIVKCVRFTG